MTSAELQLTQLACATARSRCKCPSCRQIVISTLRTFEMRANNGDRQAAVAALEIIKAHYPANLLAFYRENSTWNN